MRVLALIVAISSISLSSLAVIPSDTDSIIMEGKLLAYGDYAQVSVAQLDVKLADLIENMNSKIANLGETDDLMEGKIRATIINSFTETTKDVERKIEEFGFESSVELQDEILNDLRGLELLVKEL